MTPAHEQLYRSTLRDLMAAGIEFCVIGSFALRLQCPALPSRFVHDCDLMLPPDVASLNALAQHLQTAGWAVTLWEAPVQLPLAAEQLAGKYYLRARQAGAVLDCSYENDYLTWPEFIARLRWQDGLPLLLPEHILFQKAQRNNAADREVIQRCRMAANKSP